MKAAVMGIKKQEHGGNVYRASEETGIPVADLMDFSASINPLGVPETVKEVIRAGLDDLVHYPDPDTTGLRVALARQYSIESGSIICGNGSTELIYLIPKALMPGSVLITAPAFSEYEKACELNDNCEITYHTLKEENGFKIVPEEFIRAMEGCDMAFLCNPNNPTGDLMGKDEILRIAGAARGLKCVLVVDEAFMDFCPDNSVIGHVQDNPFLIVLRSMTKFYAITGLRAGYGVFHPEMLGRVKEFREPWTMNTLAQKSAIAAIHDSTYSGMTMALMEEEKKFIENGLSDLGIDFLPSAVNFYLCRVGSAAEACRVLKAKGILVRDCSNFRGLDDSYIRIAVRSRRENEALLGGLSEAVKWK